MHVFFSDDSSQQPMRQGMGDLVAFGGYLLHEAELRPVADEVDQLLRELRIPVGTELKWSLPPENWIRKKLPEEKRALLYSRLLAILPRHGAIACVAVWDTGRTSLAADEAFSRCVDFVFERVSIQLAKIDSHCLIVADRPGGGRAGENQFLSSFLKRLQAGTDYVPPDRVLLNVLTSPARIVRQLQLADLVTSITTAMVAMKYTFAKPAFASIRQMLMKNTYGYIGGTGLKLFPDLLVNLYHWVLEEDSYVRVRMNTGWSLPMKNRPYSMDEKGDRIPF